KACPGSALEIFYTPDELVVLAEWEKQGTLPSEEIDEEEKKRRELIAGYRNVWVFVEQTEGDAARVSWELLGAGVDLARALGVELCALVIGEKVEPLCHEAFRYGATKAYLLDHPVYKYYRTEPYLAACCHLIEKFKPEIVLMGASGMGRDLAGAVATRMKTGLTADCTGLGIDDKRNLMQTRPAFGGNIMATIMCDRFRPQMATVRPHVMPLPEKSGAATGILIKESFTIAESSIFTRVLEVITEKSGKDRVDVAGAEFIVSGG